MMSLYQLKIITTIFIIVHHLLPNINGKLPAQYYDIAVSCGSYGKSTALDGRQWIGDISSQEPKRKSTIISRANPYMTSHYDSSVVSFHADHPIPYMTARSSRSHFTYTFQVNPGQKFIRLHFYPHSYPGFERSKSLFTVKSGPYTLLSNFSASLTAESLGVKYFAKEFCVNVGENQLLSLTFSPSDDTTSLDDDVYAFINGIEIISMPDSLYYTPYGDLGARVVGNKLWFLIDKDTALEMVHRLNIGGRCILSIEDLGGMFRMWSEDKNYLLQSGVLPLTTTTLIKYVSTPTHFAPLQVYQTSWSIRSTEQTNQWYSFTWKLPVDFGFRYLVRLHFCELEITESGQKKFAVSINNKMVETNADVIEWSGGNRIAVYKDYVAMIQGDRMKGSRRDLIITLQHKYESKAKTIDTFLKGIEIFKLSNPDNNLAGANPVPTTCAPRSSIPKLRKFVSALGNKNVIATGTILVLTFIVYHLNILESNPSKTNNISSSLLDEELCRHFSLVEMQLATDYFDDANIIGKGGFGNVFKGLIDNGTKTVAIKRLKSGSGQGAREFQAEINVLSKLSHNDHLVSLIGYCDDCPEMILVYEYMDNRSLADHLHKTSRNHNGSNPLPWKRRLNICIGAARGLDFLHTGNGAHHGIIHRDVKSANILLDRSWEAKISDFGLSRMYTTSPSQTHISTMVKGTFGYMDPEYFNTQRLTKKSDVYAFGVVLFEVLGGRPAVDLTLEEEQRSLAQWAKKCLRNKKLDQLIDPSVKEQISPRCLKRFAEIANKCLHDEPNERPAMADVVKTLELIRMELQGMPDANPLYLFPQQAEVPRATQAPASGQAVNPLYLFPHGFPNVGSNTSAGTLDFRRNSQQVGRSGTVRTNERPKMKVFVKTLKGTHFVIEVKPEDTVADVKKNIETVQGPDVYPATQQMLIHQGKVLKDATTLEENQVAENTFIVIMLTKQKVASRRSSTTSAAPSAPVYGQAASNLVAGNNLESTVQQILDMGGGSWDRDTVVRALRAACNNPERAVEYLYSGFPNVGSNTSAGTVDFLRNTQQFQALRAMVQANPQTLQPMLQELGKQNPNLMRLIQEHWVDFLRLIYEPVEVGERNVPGQSAGAMPQAATITPEEHEAIERLEAMGFDRALVLEVFFACKKNEDLAANYLLDHMHEFDE